MRDGQLNPDVHTLNGPDAVNGASQSVLYKAIAYDLQKSLTNSRNIASFIDMLFLSPSTKMNPNVNYGQVFRGPGTAGQCGTFTGILDLRGTVKIVNAILLKATPNWTNARDQAVGDWMSKDVAWLQDSDIGKSGASRPK